MQEDVMAGRIILAGVVAGVVAFAWGFVSHAMLGFTENVVRPIPNETAVIGTLAENVKAPGVYVFPDAGMTASMKGTREQQKAGMDAWQKAYAVQPHGLLVFTPPSGPWNMGAMMGLQLVIQILCGLVAALLLSLAAPSIPAFLGRVLFVAAFGLFAVVRIDGSYANWYGFPTTYLGLSLFDVVIEWLIAGIALAALIKPKRA
jgi:hypothetical protein